MVSYMYEMASLTKRVRSRITIKTKRRRVVLVAAAVACSTSFVARRSHALSVVSPVTAPALSSSNVTDVCWPETFFYNSDSDLFGLSSRLYDYVVDAAYGFFFPPTTTTKKTTTSPLKKETPKKRFFGVGEKKSRPDSPAIAGLAKSTRLFQAATRRRGKVASESFLLGVEALMPTFEAFGVAVHAAAVKDVLGNVRKLKRNGAPRQREIADQVVRDFLDNTSTHPDSTAQAFLWLTRILKFTVRCFEELMRHPQKSLNACLTTAYEKELGPFHNSVMRTVAVALMQIIPDRAHLLQCFQLDSIADLAPHLRKWMDAVRPVVDRSDRLYKAQREVYYRSLLTLAQTTNAHLPPHRRIFIDDDDNKLFKQLAKTLGERTNEQRTTDLL